MGEWIRFQGVSAASGTLAHLRKLNLGIFQGEILFISGTRWSGKTLLREILGGQAEISSGRLYLDEERYWQKNFAGQPILCVDWKSQLPRTLSLKANLMSLGGGTPGKGGLRQMFRDEKEMKELSREMGIETSLSCPAGQVPARERLLLWFVLAAVRRVRLLCLDCSGCSFSEEDYQAVGQAVLCLRERGIGVVVFDDRENCLMKTADRIAWMANGQIQKIFYTVEEYRRMFDTAGRTGGRAVYSSWDEEEEAVLDIRKGQILEVYDANWPMNCRLPEYLVWQMNERGWALPDFLPMEGCISREAVYIPEDSVDYLFAEKSVGRNLMLTASRLAGVRAGFVQTGMERFLEREFCRRFGIEEPVETVEELTEGEKKLLSIYRFALLRPRVMLLENPLIQSDWEERDEMIDYLRELASSGAAMVVSAKAPEDLEHLCDRIWRAGK